MHDSIIAYLTICQLLTIIHHLFFLDTHYIDVMFLEEGESL